MFYARRSEPTSLSKARRRGSLGDEQKVPIRRGRPPLDDPELRGIALDGLVAGEAPKRCMRALRTSVNGAIQNPSSM